MAVRRFSKSERNINYFGDIGLRNAIVGYRLGDIGKILENVVFNHLKAAGYNVTVGKLNNTEIDFVCDKHRKRLYIQVAYLIPDEKTHEREFGNLLKIPDNHRKIVLSLDEINIGGNYKGVEHINIRTFLNRHPDYL